MISSVAVISSMAVISSVDVAVDCAHHPGGRILARPKPARLGQLCVAVISSVAVICSVAVISSVEVAVISSVDVAVDCAPPRWAHSGKAKACSSRPALYVNFEQSQTIEVFATIGG